MLIRWTLALLAALAPILLGAEVFAAPPVAIHIQVIEAKRKGGAFDPKLASLKSALEGYEGAKVVDEIETKVEPGGSVSLQILKRSQMLKVTVLELQKDGTIKLRVAIDELKFNTETTHKKGEATVLVGYKAGKETSLFLAVTPKVP